MTTSQRSPNGSTVAAEVVQESAHAVLFYDTDPELASTVGEYLLAGLRGGEACVVIATAAHRDEFSEALEAAGVDVARVIASGQYRVLDAAEVLAQIRAGGELTQERFVEIATGVLADAGADYRGVRLYGEIVVLLWQQGEVTAAIDLETWWNRLAGSEAFRLLCAYPWQLVSRPDGDTSVRDVCGVHSHVLSDTGQNGFEDRCDVLGRSDNGHLLLHRRAGGSRSGTAATADAADQLPLLQATLDALSCHVAVLDADGALLWVNESWERFAATNGGDGVGVGANYLTACDNAQGDPVADRVGEGLRAVIAGTAESFSLEYPCHTPAEQGWFRMVAVRSPQQGPTRVVVSHAPATTEIRAREDAQQATKRFRAVTEQMGEGLCTLDVAGRITYLNPHGEQLLQMDAAEALGERFAGLLVHTRAGIDRLASETTEELLVRPDGSLLAVEYTATPLDDDEDGRSDGWVVVLRDISERRAREDALHRQAEHATWMARIRDALRDDHFVLYAQPIVELAGGRTVQHELLLRLHDPHEGVIAPGAFLPTAEAFGLAPAIDRWVITHALRRAADGHAVELNLSAKSLDDPAILAHIEVELAASGADPGLIVFEITETALLENDEAARRFAERIRALGCQLALDDFGTGYSSFTYLKQLPVDFLKIDMEFVRDATENASSRHVIAAVVALAQAFGIETVAEGVEDEATLRLLGELGVDYAQGYHLGRPQPFDSPLRRSTLEE